MSDPVRNPKHYEIMPGLEAITIIDVVLTALEGEITPHQAYCLGNFLKYRLRAGDKDDLEQDIAKSNQYKAMLNPKGHSTCNGDCENCVECKPPYPSPCAIEDYHTMQVEHVIAPPTRMKVSTRGDYPPNWKDDGC